MQNDQINSSLVENNEASREHLPETTNAADDMHLLVTLSNDRNEFMQQIGSFNKKDQPLKQLAR